MRHIYLCFLCLTALITVIAPAAHAQYKPSEIGLAAASRTGFRAEFLEELAFDE